MDRAQQNLRCSHLLPAAAGVLLLAAACTVMDTKTVQKGTPDCQSDLGSYRLPMTYLKVVIDTEYDPSTGRVHDYVYQIQPVVRGSNHVLCLDYFSNPLSRDTIKVQRAVRKTNEEIVDQGLLQYVSSNAIDFSGIVLKKISRIFFIARSGNSGFQPFLTVKAADEKGDEKKASYLAVTIELDPLSPAQLAEANARFVQFGLCMTLGRYSYDIAQLDANAYCDSPIANEAANRTGVTTILEKQKPFPANFPGIAYRPRLDYDLYIYTKTDPTGPEPWTLREVRPIALENKAPVFSLAISRAVFAERRTVLAFDQGTLTGFCVSKSSEGAGFIEVPVEIIRSIVALPTQILQVRIDEANGQAELNKIHAETIALQTKLIRFEQGDKTALSGASPGVFKSFGPAELGSGAKQAEQSDFGAPPEASDLSSNDAFLKDLCQDRSAGTPGG